MTHGADPAVAAIRRRVASRVGWGTAALFVLIMAAGADHPPPPGFALVVVAAGGLAVALRAVLPPLLDDWQAHGARKALLRAGMLGAGAGALTWGIASALRLDPSVAVPPAARLTGLVVLIVVAVASSLAVAAVSRAWEVRARRSAGSRAGQDPGPAD